jgi:hypothetical protein
MTKTLAAERIRLNQAELIQQAADPTTGAGVAAAIGTFYLRGTAVGEAYLKTGVADTAWTKLVQSFGWYSVKDYGATGDNSTDDTAAIQAAHDACAAAGGGVVFFPSGTYRVTQLTWTAQDAVQWKGAGTSSSLRWTFNAAGAAGSMITISDSDHIVIENMKFDGAGLTNPAGSRLNHLIALGTGAAGSIDHSIRNCFFTGMVANSGDGVHILGAAAKLIQNVWIEQCRFDGCSRFGVGIEQGLQYGWITENYLTNCETDIAMVATAALANTGVIILENEIVHTGTTRHALRIEGDQTTVSDVVICAENVVIGGFCTTSGVIHAVLENNVVTSGSFASTDALWRIFGNVAQLACQRNVMARSSGSSAGPLFTFELSGGNHPSLFNCTGNVLANDKAGANFVKVVDCTRFQVQDNICKSADAGATNYAVDVQAVTVAATDFQVGPGNTFTADAGSYAACVRVLSNGANVTDFSVNGNQGDNCDYGLRTEIIGGATFNGQAMHGTNNWDAATGDVQQVGTAIKFFIGFNAGTVGATLRSGAGSPEGVVTARIGSMYLRTDGGQDSSVYYKESGTGNTGWLAIAGTVLTFGVGDTTTSAAARYFAPGFITTASSTEIKIAISRPGTLRNLRVWAGAVGTDAQTVTFTVRKNGVDTTITCSLSNDAAGAASDTTHSVTVAQGDQISISIVKAAGVTAGQTNVCASLELV